MQFEKPLTPNFDGEPNLVTQMTALWQMKLDAHPAPEPKLRVRLVRQLRKWVRKSKQVTSGAL